MKYIRNTSIDPYYNLAFEEYILNNLRDDTYILLWQNNNTIVVGQHQNTLEEINQQEVLNRDIKVVRRITGGGTVYHDMGNLNFSFITDWNCETDLVYEKFLEPIVRALKKIGITAEKKGRNDLVINDKKISGNAQAICGNRILHHGTILIDSDLSIMPHVLNVSADKIISKSVKSVRSRVANVSEFSEVPINVELLKNILLETFFEPGEIEEIELNENQLIEIECMAKEKYSTWDWNYGKSPKYNFRNKRRFDGGGIEVENLIENGIISECKIYGDFLSLKSISPIEKALVGIKFDQENIKKVLEQFDLRLYFGEIKEEDILSCFC